MSRYRKWIDLSLGLAALALWFILRQMLSQIWEIFRLPLWEALPVQPPVLISALLAVAAFVIVRTNTKAYTFLDEVANELAKVAWPTPKETVASTGVIIIMVGIAAIILFGFDALWGTLTQSFLTL